MVSLTSNLSKQKQEKGDNVEEQKAVASKKEKKAKKLEDKVESPQPDDSISSLKTVPKNAPPKRESMK